MNGKFILSFYAYRENAERASLVPFVCLNFKTQENVYDFRRGFRYSLKNPLQNIVTGNEFYDRGAKFANGWLFFASAWDYEPDPQITLSVIPEIRGAYKTRREDESPR